MWLVYGRHEQADADTHFDQGKEYRCDYFWVVRAFLMSELEIVRGQSKARTCKSLLITRKTCMCANNTLLPQLISGGCTLESRHGFPRRHRHPRRGPQDNSPVPDVRPLSTQSTGPSPSFAQHLTSRALPVLRCSPLRLQSQQTPQLHEEPNPICQGRQVSC